MIVCVSAWIPWIFLWRDHRGHSGHSRGTAWQKIEHGIQSIEKRELGVHGYWIEAANNTSSLQDMSVRFLLYSLTAGGQKFDFMNSLSQQDHGRSDDGGRLRKLSKTFGEEPLRHLFGRSSNILPKKGCRVSAKRVWRPSDCHGTPLR